MSPVGSYESLQAAIQGGANAIYFGVGKLNMRSRSAANFTTNDLPLIVAKAQQVGVRAYLTVNTIIYDAEIEEMHTLLDRAKEVGVNAVIASDMAAITAARERGIEVHISTQSNVSNREAIRFYARYADVIVAARELSLRQVADITQYIRDNHICGPRGELLQVELFGHGALCMSVSGKCYLSLDTMNHSANRGACMQLCRRKYRVTDAETGEELEVDGKYIMSPKDLCTIGIIDKIVHAGVSVLKIEGRGRSADYVQTVTRCYREALDAIGEGSYTQEKVQEWTRQLRTVFNRGFWEGYYMGRTMGEWSERYGSQATENKVYLGRITNYYPRPQVAEARIETAEQLHSGDRLMATGQTTGVYSGTATELRLDRDPVPAVQQGDIFSFPTTTPLHRGDKLYRIDTVTDEF